MTKASILYISYDGMTDPLGQSQVLPYLKGLSALGYKICLISAEKSERFATKETIEKLCKESNIDWFPIPYTKKPPVFSTLYDCWKIKRLAKKLHTQYQFDIIHCRSYIPALFGLYFKRRFGLKFIFDMRGFWADERVDGGIWNLKKPLYKILYIYFKFKEKEFFHNADYTISLTEKGKEVIEKEIVLKSLNIKVIPCCADTDHFSLENVSASKKQEFEKVHNITSEDKLLGYVGSLGTWYLLDDMMRFFAKLYQKDNSYKFVVLTLDDAAMVFASAANLGVPADRLIVTPAQREDLPTYMSMFRASLFFIKPAFSKQASSPTKQGELMAMGVPVLANAGIGDSDAIITRYNSGKLIDLEDLNSADAVIAEFEKIEDLDPEKIRKGALEFFSLENGIAKYQKVYEAVLAAK